MNSTIEATTVPAILTAISQKTPGCVVEKIEKLKYIVYYLIEYIYIKVSIKYYYHHYLFILIII